MDLKAPTHVPAMIAAAMGATIVLGIATPSVVDDIRKIFTETAALLVYDPSASVETVKANGPAEPPYLNRGAPAHAHSRFFRDNKKLRLLGD